MSYERKFAVHSARLTVLTVWPGSRYPDLCLGGFVPVFRGPPKRSLDTFLGAGSELAPTLALFMDSPGSIDDLLPPKTSKVAAWIRTYPEVPHRGSLPEPEEEHDMVTSYTAWRHYRRTLDKSVFAAAHQSELFRLLPEPGGRGYVFDPIGPPRGERIYSNFRAHWAHVEGAWRLVGLDVKYWEQTGDD